MNSVSQHPMPADTELKYIQLNNEKQLSDFAPFSFLRELNSGETIGATIETKNPVGKYRIPTLAGLRGPMKIFSKPLLQKLSVSST